MDNEKRTLLAITLSMVILLVYQVFFSPEPKKQDMQEPTPQEKKVDISSPKPIIPTQKSG